MPRDLDTLLGDVRALLAGLKRGDRGAFHSWRDLAQHLLALTVAEEHEALGLTFLQGRTLKADLCGRGCLPDRLRNGKFLRFHQALEIQEDPRAGPRLKVVSSTVRYQMDAECARWLFRFDYLQLPRSPYPHPRAHLQVLEEPFEEA